MLQIPVIFQNSIIFLIIKHLNLSEKNHWTNAETFVWFQYQRHAYKLMRHAMVTRKIKYGLFCELEMKKMSGIRSMIYLSIYYSSLWMLQEEQCFTTKILLTSNKLRILLSCILWILELKESGIIVPCMHKYCVTFCIFILFMKYHSSG